jgi:hypothetical protein
MPRITLIRRVGFAVATAWCLLASSAMRAKAQVPPPPAADNPPPPPTLDAASGAASPAAGDAGEVLTRGPVHEAFAQPLPGDPTNALIVPRQPPEPIEEEPPAAKPDGENVLWISGYWAWDDDRKDFLWVSGVWRDAPPGQVWVAGYWSAVEGGYQWTSGFWTPATQQNVSYLPAPPASVDNGPNTEPPSESDVWVPGNFMYRETRYVWRPGFWSRAQPNWIWVPAHYVWTPGGYVFVDGFWDFPLVRRGVMFAPVYFATPIYRRPRFRYSPAIVIDAGLLTVNFFARPSYCHYYFGDYYDPSYSRWGFRPWISAGAGGVRAGFGYDPLLVYYRYEHRRDPGWFNTQRERYTFLENHPADRPPRTYIQQTKIVNNAANIQFTNINKITNIQNNVVIAAPLTQVVKNTTINHGGGNEMGGIKFQTLTNQQRQTYTAQAATFRQISTERAKLETPSGGAKGPIGVGPAVIAPTHKTLNLQPLVQATGGKDVGPRTTEPAIGVNPIGKEPGRGPIGREPIGKEPIGREPIGREPIGKLPTGTLPGVTEPITRPSVERPPTITRPPVTRPPVTGPKTPEITRPEKGPPTTGEIPKGLPSTPPSKGPPLGIGPKLPPGITNPKTPNIRPEPKPEVRPETRPETRPQPKPEVRPEPKPEPRPEARPKPSPPPPSNPDPSKTGKKPNEPRNA